MGSEDLFRKRKARQAKKLVRRAAKRDSYDKVLIVCEGSKTEPQYFCGLRSHYRLNTANVLVTGDSGSSPSSILRHAKQQYRHSQDTGDPYDRVYCVFDRDSHADYDQACSDICTAKPAGTFFAIPSVPCFEYWLLLHFTFTTSPYNHLPGNSAATQVLTALKGYLPNYEKGNPDIFAQTQDSLQYAMQNAARALAHVRNSGGCNPSTQIHELVKYLQGLKKIASASSTQ